MGGGVFIKIGGSSYKMGCDSYEMGGASFGPAPLYGRVPWAFYCSLCEEAKWRID